MEWWIWFWRSSHQKLPVGLIALKKISKKSFSWSRVLCTLLFCCLSTSLPTMFSLLSMLQPWWLPGSGCSQLRTLVLPHVSHTLSIQGFVQTSPIREAFFDQNGIQYHLILSLCMLSHFSVCLCRAQHYLRWWIYWLMSSFPLSLH